MKLPKKKLERGDYVRVTWVDITTDAHETPDNCSAAHSVTLGHFYEIRKRKDGTRELITAQTRHDWNEGEWEGGDAYPVGAVLRVDRLEVV